MGAPWDDDNGANSGSAYVFHYDGSAWIEEARLFAVDAWSPYEYFGWSVSLSGDRALSGAWGDDDRGGDAGTAYVFRYDGTTWVKEAKLYASDAWYGTSFGVSVSLSGEYALIGATIGSNSPPVSAYIFRHDGSGWFEDAKLIASRGGLFDFFGAPVSLSGDYALVGASGNDDQGTDAGSAYVYSGFVTSSPSSLPLEFAKSPKQMVRGQNVDREAIPTGMFLFQNYPNPFNPSTTFRYGLSEPSQVTLRIYNMLGQLVRTVVNDFQSEGYYEAVWDGTNEHGASVAGGTYIYRLEAGRFSATKRMLFLK